MIAPTRSAALDAAIDTHMETAIEFLARLVACPSELGREAEAQAVLGDALERLGFDVERLAVPQDIGSDPVAGVPQISYEGRSVLVGRRRLQTGAGGRSLLLNGHLDVVPPGDMAGWTHPPYEPYVRDGWMIGRGAGDMKGGIAMAVLAVSALLEVCDEDLAGEVIFVGAIEEECTGNGTLASVRAGVVADAAVLPESTDLELMVSGIGVLWLEATLSGRAGHAEGGSDGGVLDDLCALRDALAGFEDELNDGRSDRPFRVVVGRVDAGDWPSSVPGSARVSIRVGFSAHWTPDEAESRVRDWLAQTMGARTVALRQSGFRAHAYEQGDAALLDLLTRAHADAHGAELKRCGVNATTDARFYVNDARIPAVCFGPRSRAIHGPDEGVEIASIAAGARTLARFMAQWLSANPSEDACQL